MTKEAKLEILKLIIYGTEKALWNAMGKASLAFTPIIGENICEKVQSELGEKIENIDTKEIAKRIGEIYTKELQISKEFKINEKEHLFEMNVRDCFLIDVEKKLIEDKITPFICPFLNAVAYILRMKKNMKSRIKEIAVDVETKSCKLAFELF